MVAIPTVVVVAIPVVVVLARGLGLFALLLGGPLLGLAQRLCLRLGGLLGGLPLCLCLRLVHRGRGHHVFDFGLDRLVGLSGVLVDVLGLGLGLLLVELDL